MIYHVQPWMIAAVLPMMFLIEGSRLATSSQIFASNSLHLTGYYLALVGVGGLIAMTMELCEYLLLSHTSSITLNICGIVKVAQQLLTTAPHSFAGDLHADTGPLSTQRPNVAGERGRAGAVHLRHMSARLHEGENEPWLA